MGAEEKPGAILITGAARGLGRALTLGLAQRGWPLWLHHCATSIEPLLQKIPSHLIRGVVQADLTQQEECNAFVEKILTTGESLYGIVHNAGDYVRTSLEETSPEVFRHLLALNLEAPLQISRGLLPLLRATRGVMIHLTHPGVTEVRADRVSPAYSVTKVALQQLTRCWAVELAKEGVRVHAVAPGISSEEASWKTDEVLSTLDHLPQMDPQELVEVVTWLIEAPTPSLTGGCLELGSGLRL